MKRVALLAAALGTLAPLALSAQSRCEFRETLELSGSAGEELRVRAGSGLLDIQGGDVGRIEVTAVKCASEEGWLGEMDITLDEDGGRTTLEAHYPDRRLGGWGDSYARIDLVIRVPSSLALDVSDRAGSASIAGVGRLVVRDGSGSLEIRGAGDVIVEDGSGNLTIEDVTGNLDVSDGSGGLEISSVTGDVVVADGSGGIEIEGVGGTVRVREMGSGQLRVDGVGGDLIVDQGRYERIRHRNVDGELKLPESRKRRRS